MIARSAVIHSAAIIDAGATIGERTRVWAFSHILSGAVIGDDCNICDHTFVEGGVRIGNRVTVKCGVYLWDGITIDDDAFIGPAAAFTNDIRPRSRRRPEQYSQTHLEKGCSIGANSTILPVVIGAWSMIASGSVVTKDVPAHSLVLGSPARVHRWICECGKNLQFGLDNLSSCDCGRYLLTESGVRKIIPDDPKRL